MLVNPITDSMCKAKALPNGSLVVTYDDPRAKDEECTYTFNQDGSATRVSNAWGTKTELPRGTFVYGNQSESLAEMVNSFNAYSSYRENLKLDVQA